MCRKVGRELYVARLVTELCAAGTLERWLEAVSAAGPFPRAFALRGPSK